MTPFWFGKKEFDGQGGGQNERRRLVKGSQPTQKRILHI